MCRYVDSLNVLSLICYINSVCSFFKLESFPLVPRMCVLVFTGVFIHVHLYKSESSLFGGWGVFYNSQIQTLNTHCNIMNIKHSFIFFTYFC